MVQRAGQPDYVRSFDEDLMERAMKRARDTQNEFVTAIRNKKPNVIGLAVKKPFPAGAGQEHIWLNEVNWDGAAFEGVVNNEPVDTKAVKLGDRARVRPDELSDWMFVENGALQGGFTIRVLYHQMPEAQKKEFLKQVPFTVPAVDF